MTHPRMLAVLLTWLAQAACGDKTTLPLWV